MDRGYLNYAADTSSDLYMLHYGIKQCPPLDTCGPMIRNMYLIHYIIKGKGWFCDGKNKYNLNPGDIFAIYPDDVVSYGADESDPCLYCWIGFNGSKSNECYDKIGISRSMPVRTINDSSFMHTINDCLDCKEKGGISQLRLTGYLYEALSCLEKNNAKNVSSRKTSVNAAIMYMEYNFDKGILASDAAKYAGFEYSYFYRLFKKQIGISPEKYLINIRIEKSKKLIRAGYELKEIPPLIGINNIYYFSKLFKQYTGLTPTQYKKLLIKAPPAGVGIR
mgnify:CR=1 FL=1